MSDGTKVIWSEGLFLRPQHFQQQERYFERYIEGRAAGLGQWPWGFEELELSREHLAIGKLAIKRATGVFPDGTPFSIPDHDPAPQPLDVPAEMHARVVLALPLRRAGALESDRRAVADGLARQLVRELELRDVTQETAATATVEVGGLRLRLIAEGGSTADFACLPMAYVDGRRAEQVRVDDTFMPTALRVKACPPLDAFLTEYLGMLSQRLDVFGRIVGGGGRGGGIGELADLLKLQAIGRYEALIRHFGESANLHPEELYRWMLVMAGDFVALASDRPSGMVFPAYRHDDLTATFKGVIGALRAYTPNPGLSRAVKIEVQLRKPNYYVAKILDSTLIDSAEFILAVRADLPDRQMERTFPKMAKIAPVTRLDESMQGATGGLILASMPQIPPYIPYRTNHVYFSIIRNSPWWADMKGSAAFGLFVPEGFPNLGLEMWAIRGG